MHVLWKRICIFSCGATKLSKMYFKMCHQHCKVTNVLISENAYNGRTGTHIINPYNTTHTYIVHHDNNSMPDNVKIIIIFWDILYVHVEIYILKMIPFFI